MNIEPGTTVKVFEDPATCKMYEGMADVKRIHRIDTVECIVDAAVNFHGEGADVVYRRSINFSRPEYWKP